MTDYVIEQPVTFTRRVEIRDSSNLTHVFYDPVTKAMLVEFYNDRQYLIENVPSEIFGAIISGESVGRLYHKLITRDKENFKIKRLSDLIESEWPSPGEPNEKV